MIKDKKVLIVDDDKRNIFALSMVLKSMGALCMSAENGQVGMKLMKENPDLDYVFMDMMMPVMDGYEAIKMIKSNRETRHIPVIALTARAMKGDREKCLDAGADSYLSKPVDTDELKEVLTKFKK